MNSKKRRQLRVRARAKTKKFRDILPGTHCLIIGGGFSAANLEKDWIQKFDIVIGCNKGAIFYDEFLDFHIIPEQIFGGCAERGVDAHVLLQDKKYRRDLPRLVCYRSLDFYPSDCNIIPIFRNTFGYGFARARYDTLLAGSGVRYDFRGKPYVPGSVVLTAIHFCHILGCSRVSLVGAELIFKSNTQDHFYDPGLIRYREEAALSEKDYNYPTPQHEIIKVVVNNIEYDTTRYMKESAEEIDDFIRFDFSHIKFYDYSGGLLRQPKKESLG